MEENVRNEINEVQVKSVSESVKQSQKDDSPIPVDKKKLNVLVVGDWIIDENIIVASEEPGISSHYGDQMYIAANNNIKSQTLTLCAAGTVARFLHGFSQESDVNRSNLEFSIYGVGYWEPEDTTLISALFRDEIIIHNQTPQSLRGMSFIESKEGCKEKPLCGNENRTCLKKAPLKENAKMNNNETGESCGSQPKSNGTGGCDIHDCNRLLSLGADDSGTYRVQRMFQHTYSKDNTLKNKLIHRVDWPYAIIPAFDSDRERKLDRFIKAAQNQKPADGSVTNFDIVIVVDHKKGAVSEDLLKFLINNEATKDARWYYRCKKLDNNILKLLTSFGSDNLKLVLDGPVIEDERVDDWFVQHQLTYPAIEHLLSKFDIDLPDKFSKNPEEGYLKNLEASKNRIGGSPNYIYASFHKNNRAIFISRKDTWNLQGYYKSLIDKSKIKISKELLDSLGKDFSRLNKEEIEKFIAKIRLPNYILDEKDVEGITDFLKKIEIIDEFNDEFWVFVIDDVPSEPQFEQGRTSILFASLIAELELNGIRPMKSGSKVLGRKLDEANLLIALNKSYQWCIQYEAIFNKEPYSVNNMVNFRNVYKHENPYSNGGGFQGGRLSPLYLEIEAWAKSMSLETYGANSVSYDLVNSIDVIPQRKIQVWRGWSGLPGYICLDDNISRQIKKLRKAIKNFSSQKQRKQSLCSLITGQPGGGKSYLAELLAKDSGLQLVSFNITHLTSIDELVSCFDVISSLQAQQPSTTFMVFFDEINAQIAGQYVYSCFLSPMLDGKYQRDGRMYLLRPCVWLFAGTIGSSSFYSASERLKTLISEGNNISFALHMLKPDHNLLRSEISAIVKGPDFLSRINGPKVSLVSGFEFNGSTESDIAVFEAVEMFDRAQKMEKIYVLISMVNRRFPEIVLISKLVLEYFTYVIPRDGNRSLQFLVDKFRPPRHDRLTVEAIPFDEDLSDLIIFSVDYYKFRAKNRGKDGAKKDDYFVRLTIKPS